MRYYPAFLDLDGKLCVVIGGGAIAARKAEALLRAGAAVRVVAPRLAPALRRMRVEWRRARYSCRHLHGAWLAIACTSDRRVQETIRLDAERHGVFCNVADSARGSSFLVPASFRRGGLQVAVSTGGDAPALARRVRIELERLFGPEYAELLALLAELRPRVMARVTSNGRRDRLRRMVDSAALDLLRQGRRDEARRLLERIAETGVRAGR